MAFVVLSVLSALRRTKPSLIWNYVKYWYIGSFIVVMMAGTFGALLFDLSPPVVAQWVSGYHTFCWLWYEPQMNWTIGALVVGIVVIAVNLSVSAYYRVVTGHEVQKLNHDANISQFILKKHSEHSPMSSNTDIAAVGAVNADNGVNTVNAVDIVDGVGAVDKKFSSLHNSLLGAGKSMENESNFTTKLSDDREAEEQCTLEMVGDVSAADLNAFYKKEIGIDLHFRLQCIVIIEVLRMMLNLTFISWIMTDEGDEADQSFYLLELIGRFVSDSQAFITFLAFCVSEPFVAYLKFLWDRLTCGAFRRPNPLAQAVAPTKYVLH